MTDVELPEERADETTETTIEDEESADSSSVDDDGGDADLVDEPRI